MKLNGQTTLFTYKRFKIYLCWVKQAMEAQNVLDISSM